MRLRPLAVACGLLGLALPSEAGAPQVPMGCRPRPDIPSLTLSAAAADRLRLAPSTTRGGLPGEFSLSDGRILFQAEAGLDGAVYSRSAFRQRNAELDEELRFRKVTRGESFHVLRGLIDDGATFAADLPSLGGRLRHRLERERIEEKDPLKAMTLLGQQWRTARCRLDPSLFRELTAGLGEVLLARAPTARWATRTVGGVVEPIIELKVGFEKRSLTPWLWASELLAGETDLAAHVTEAVEPRRFVFSPPPVEHPPVDAGRASEADGGVDGGKGCPCPCTEKNP